MMQLHHRIQLFIRYITPWSCLSTWSTFLPNGWSSNDTCSSLDHSLDLLLRAFSVLAAEWVLTLEVHPACLKHLSLKKIFFLLPFFKRDLPLGFVLGRRRRSICWLKLLCIWRNLQRLGVHGKRLFGFSLFSLAPFSELLFLFSLPWFLDRRRQIPSIWHAYFHVMSAGG